MLDKTKRSFGIELELGDYNNQITIPEELGVYNKLDPSVINSNGLANDPQRKYVLLGGEINVTPSNSIDGLLKNIEGIYKTLPNACSNFKTNIHTHFYFPGLAEDFKKLHKLIEYNFKYEEEMMDLVNPFPEPLDSKMVEFLKYKKKSQKRCFGEKYKSKILGATTWEGIRDSHQPMKDGRRLAHLSPRTGINTKSLWKRGTIEFRHWFGTDDLDQYRNVLEWGELYIENALGEQLTPKELLATRDWNFPTMLPWNRELLEAWEETNFQRHKRGEVKEILTKKLENGEISKEYLGSMFG